MNDQRLSELLEQLAAEPAADASDPWPAVRSRLERRRAKASRISLIRRAGFAAAVLALLLGGAAYLLVDRAEPVTAAEVLNRLELEAKPFAIAIGTTECMPKAIEGAPSPTDLTDRIGQILGVSGDRVREALREAKPATFGVGYGVAGAGAPPGAAPAGGMAAGAPIVDPIARIARELGLSREQVSQALRNPACPDQMILPRASDTATTERIAKTLGVSPARLSAAIAAALPPLPPPGTPLQAPPGGSVKFVAAPDEVMSRVAARLGVSKERLEAAMKEAAQAAPGNRIQILTR